VQPSASQNLSDADLAHARKKDAQLLDEIADEVRESVHRLGGLDQRSLALFIDPSHPGAQRLFIDQERSRSLGTRPAAGGLDTFRPSPGQRNGLL
jgi:hypothetical protein